MVIVWYGPPYTTWRRPLYVSTGMVLGPPDEWKCNIELWSLTVVNSTVLYTASQSWISEKYKLPVVVLCWNKGWNCTPSFSLCTPSLAWCTKKLSAIDKDSRITEIFVKCRDLPAKMLWFCFYKNILFLFGIIWSFLCAFKVYCVNITQKYLHFLCLCYQSPCALLLTGVTSS